MENLSEIQSQFMTIAETEVLLPQSRPKTLLQQCLRFGVVGVLNAGIDLVIFNVLVWLFPTHNANVVLLFNVFAYGLGAINSFILNKYWTFYQGRRTRKNQVLRFGTVTAIGICCNSAIVWLCFQVLQPLDINTFIAANMAKIAATIVTAAISFICMRTWVFAASDQANYKL